MSSSQQPIYWDSVILSMASIGGAKTVSTYLITLPQGTIGWRIVNGDATATNTIEVASNAATIAASGPPGIFPMTIAGAGGTMDFPGGLHVYVRNRNAATPPVQVMWWRPGRQPVMDAGTATISADLTP
tara:strand:+ start:7218 stop:7604 length:387 start_codon:yes stop_codon:yes gene_type:complete